MSHDYYELLGVPPDAGPGEIRRAYHRRAQELHPDASGDGSTAGRFHEATVAYETLCDPLRRRRYDEARARAEQAERRLSQEAEERRRAAQEAERRRREAEAASAAAAEGRTEQPAHNEYEDMLHGRWVAEQIVRQREPWFERYLARERRRREKQVARAQRWGKPFASPVYLLCGVLMCVACVLVTLFALSKREEALESHRADPRATATVTSFDKDEHFLCCGAGRDIEVEFRDRDGRRQSATLHSLSTDYRVGQEVKVAYDRDDPKRADFADPCEGGSQRCYTSRSYFMAIGFAWLIGILFLTAFSPRPLS